METNASQQTVEGKPIDVMEDVGYNKIKGMLQAISPAHAEYFADMYGAAGDDWRREIKKRCLLPPEQQKICEAMAALVFQNQDLKSELAKHNIPIPE